MTILFDATRTVKPARSPRRFGAGILRALPAFRADHTAADETWLAGQNAADSAWDRMAAESLALAAHERGHVFA